MNNPPLKNSKEYKKLLKLGCGLIKDEWNGDYDCSFGYEWSCDDCPINTQNE